MSNPISIDVKGLDTIRQMAKEQPAKVADAIASSIQESALIVSGQAKLATTTGPTRALDTGRLRASIGGGGFSGGSFGTSEGITLSPLRATVMPTVKYAIFVHQGTRYMDARPFMEVAREQSVDKVRSAFEYHIRQILPA